MVGDWAFIGASQNFGLTCADVQFPQYGRAGSAQWEGTLGMWAVPSCEQCWLCGHMVWGIPIYLSYVYGDVNSNLATNGKGSESFWFWSNVFK